MARKPKTESKKIVRQLTPENKLNNLLKSARSCAKQVNEITGSHREKIANAVEKDHLHKGAFAWIKALDKKEPEEIAAWLDHFNHYLDVSGIQKRADDAPNLGLEDDDTGEPDEDKESRRPRLVAGGEGQAAAGGTPG